MMGYNHALSGAAAWVAIASSAPSLPTLGLVEMSPWQLAAGAVVCAGAALLPDTDHHSATIAHSVPTAGPAATTLVGSVSGGHRKGMHSLLAVIGCWNLSGWIGANPVAGSIAIAALLAFAIKTTGIVKKWWHAWAFGALAATGFAVLLPQHADWFQPGWFQVCVTVGFAAHIFGDFLTTEGVNWVWPLTVKAPRAISRAPGLGLIWKRNGYLALPILGKTGSWREKTLGSLLGLYAAWGITESVIVSTSSAIGAH